MGFGVTLAFSHISISLGILISAVIWLFREYMQHKRWIWWNLDLAFIYSGIIVATLITIKYF